MVPRRNTAVKTTAYQVLGQGVCYRPFFALGHVAGEAAPFQLIADESREPVLA